MDHTTAPTQGLLESAHTYIDNHWPVLALYPLRDGECACPESYKTAKRCKPGKHPIGDLVPQAHVDATLDKAVATTWWTLWPDANIGIALGPAGLIDVAPDSVEWWAEFHARGLPPTAHFISGGGEGHGHWLYQRGDLPSLRIARRGRFDILSDGYAVMPPSRHASGQWYRWEGDSPPTVYPDWLGEVVRRYEAARSERVGEAVTPRDTDEPPVALTANQLDVWNGQVEADDRSGGLVELARMLATAGYQDADGLASVLAERDLTLGWEKYANRKDASQRYREIAERYGRIAPKIHLSGVVSSRPFSTPPTREETTPELQGWTWAGDAPRPEDDDQAWYVKGWIGPNIVTLITAQTKVGKTTWTLQGLVASLEEADEFCGQEVNGPLRVAYLTEERDNVFQQVLYRTGHAWEGTRDLRYRVQVNVPQVERFEQTIDQAVEMCLAEGLQVLVVDTLDVWARIYGDDENKAGVARKVMEPLKRAASKGLAVVALRHEGVEVRDVQIAGRGSSAYAGDADILISLRKMKGDDVKRHRVVEASGRFGSATPDSVVVELTAEERYVRVGSNASEVKLSRPLDLIEEWLVKEQAVDLESGQGVQEVRAGVHKGEASTKQALSTLLDQGRLEAGLRPSTEVGGRAKQVYWVVSSRPSTTPPTREETSRARAAPEGPTFIEPVSSQPPVPPRSREKTPEAVAKAAEKKALAELARLDAADAAAPPLDYYTALTDAELVNHVGMLRLESVALDTETTGLSAKRDRLRTVQVSDGETHLVIDAWSVTDWSSLQRYLDDVGEVRMHTYLFDLAFLQQVGISIDPSKIYDVRTASVVLESREDFTDYRLQGIAKRHLAQHVDKKEQRRGWDAPVLRHAKLAYAAEDARVTHAAAAELAARIAQDKDANRLEDCLTLERDVQAATWWLASAGAPADREVMAQAVTAQEALIAGKLEILNGYAEGINWNSAKAQVLPVLQARGVEVESTSEDALMEAESEDPLIDVLLDYRSAVSCLRLLRTSQSRIQDDGRIYASFSPIGAQTGRTSCSEPNLQNLPRETRAREAIRPPAGRVFVRADYSQLQLVIAAHIAQDQEMLRILNEPGGDIHQRTADAVGCTRDEAKAVNFGFLFGAGAKTFRRSQRSHGIDMTLAQAAEYRTLFMRTYRGIRSWHRGLGEWGAETVVYDPSGSGRRRLAIFSNNVKANTPVQMVEAHGFKRAMIGLHASRHEVPSARLVMMVHDELIAECDEQDADVVAVWLKREMTYGMQPLVGGVTVKVDATIVPSYSDEDKKLRGRKV